MIDMKKKNLLCAILSNTAIVALIAVLFFVCNPLPSSVAAYSPIYSGDKEYGSVALMFNVYEGSDNVEKILKILENNRITCTFFVGGVWAEKNIPLLKKMAERAEIGNHGYLHLDHKELSARRNLEEIMLCHNLVKTTCGITMNLFAPPSGAFNDDTIACATNLGYQVIMWSRDTIDWRDQDTELIYERATNKLSNGELVLMHPTRCTALALPRILDYCIENNLNVVPVSDNILI